MQSCLCCNVQIIRISYYVSANFLFSFHQQASNDERWASTMAYDIYLIIRIIYFYEIHCYAVDSLQRSSVNFFPTFVHLLTWHLMLMMLIGKHVHVSVCVRAQRNGVLSSRLTFGMDSRVHQPAMVNMNLNCILLKCKIVANANRTKRVETARRKFIFSMQTKNS